MQETKSRIAGRPPVPGADPLNVVHMTSEYWPLAQTGGLAGAVTGLAKAQAARGMQVTVVLPLYRTVRRSGLELVPHGEPFEVVLDATRETVRLFRVCGDPDGPRVFLIQHERSFDRAELYGEDGADYEDNLYRYALFCRAALAVLPDLVDHPMVLHAHDWHAALAPIFLKSSLAGVDGYDGIATVFTAHNAGFQGQFSAGALGSVGLAGTPDLVWNGALNLLRGGVSRSDMTTTVSPTHETELRTPEGGFGLHELFTSLGGRLVGILNRVDFERWNPETDPHLPARYCQTDLTGKRPCKTALRREYGLPHASGTPIVAMSARLVAQKGMDLVMQVIHDFLSEAQFVFLGRGEERFETALRDVMRDAPLQVAVPLEFSDEQEHRVLAGADLLLMPSLYEPCGLTQMRAMQYGTIPVARRVGGLTDTIVDGATGFLFDRYDPQAFAEALRRALSAYQNRRAWRAMVRRAMSSGIGWDQSALEYADVYREALEARGDARSDAPADLVEMTDRAAGGRWRSRLRRGSGLGPAASPAG